MGIRQSVLDEELDFQSWASWKEQLSFGGAADSYALAKELPHIETNAEDSKDFLFFVVAHEFGHFLDSTNGINSRESCEGEGADRICTFAPDTWGSISWANTETPKPAADFPNRAGLCFYTCDKVTLAPSLAPALYESLNKSAFISAYAATNYAEEFADSFALYLVDEYLHVPYTVKLANGKSYDLMAKLNSPIFAEKKKYLSDFTARYRIFYP